VCHEIAVELERLDQSLPLRPVPRQDRSGALHSRLRLRPIPVPSTAQLIDQGGIAVGAVDAEVESRDVIPPHELTNLASHEDAETILVGRWPAQKGPAYRAAEAVVLRAEGKERQAFAAAEEVLSALVEIRPADQAVKVAFPQALEAALALGERERAEQLLTPIEALPPGRLAPSLRAHAASFRARLAAEDGESRKAEQGFAAAAVTFREFGMPFLLAVTLIEHGEWLLSEDRVAEAEPLLAEARETFERLQAKPWLKRVEAAEARPREEARA
jgi:hypothetical protein